LIPKEVGSQYLELPPAMHFVIEGELNEIGLIDWSMVYSIMERLDGSVQYVKKVQNVLYKLEIRHQRNSLRRHEGGNDSASMVFNCLLSLYHAYYPQEFIDTPQVASYY
jgi:hypothetical protein